MNYKRLFLNWLEQHHIRQEFLYNCRTIRGVMGPSHRYPIKYIWEVNPCFYIENSFAWTESRQRGYYWSIYNNLWIRYLNNYKFTHHIK